MSVVLLDPVANRGIDVDLDPLFSKFRADALFLSHRSLADEDALADDRPLGDYELLFEDRDRYRAVRLCLDLSRVVLVRSCPLDLVDEFPLAWHELLDGLRPDLLAGSDRTRRYLPGPDGKLVLMADERRIVAPEFVASVSHHALASRASDRPPGRVAAIAASARRW